MTLSLRNLVVSTVACASVAALILACGSTTSEFPDGDPNPPVFPEDDFTDGGPPQDDLYKNDPPPAWCGPDAGTPPPPITGTEDCPDDKNKPGCGCTTLGEEADCWTGLRKHRHLGICKDGRTKCLARNETSNVWGPCEGQVLPNPEGKGAEACSCFSAGEWNIANTSPCIREKDGAYWAHATVLSGDQSTYCTDSETVPVGQTPPASAGPWSTNTLKVDCAGTFHLCYKIRAGDFNAPKASDCTLGEVCVDVDYAEADVLQALPDLPTWAGKDAACAKQWELDTPEDKSPGYGEMIVKGQTVRCDAIDDGNGNDFVFHRVQYCPRMCRDAANAGAQPCQACQLASRGQF